MNKNDAESVLQMSVDTSVTDLQGFRSNDDGGTQLQGTTSDSNIIITNTQ